jgi:hypothetical protein
MSLIRPVKQISNTMIGESMCILKRNEVCTVHLVRFWKSVYTQLTACLHLLYQEVFPRSNTLVQNNCWCRLSRIDAIEHMLNRVTSQALCVTPVLSCVGSSTSSCPPTKLLSDAPVIPIGVRTWHRGTCLACIHQCPQLTRSMTFIQVENGGKSHHTSYRR